MLNIFISGLERQSGKTLVSAGLAGTMQSLNYSTRVFKPIQTCAKDLNGFSQSQDLAFVKRIVPELTVILLPTFTPPSVELVALGSLAAGKVP